MLSVPPRFDPLKSAIERIMAADPFLMSAAIAYNVSFAVVPLALAAVAALSIVGSGVDGVTQAERILAEVFPAQIVDFIVSIIEEAQQTVGSMETVLIVVSLLVALWSGSRAIYAIQKALRTIEGVEEWRPYWVTRGLGIFFTVGAGIALILSYVVLIFGDWLLATLREHGLDVGSLTWLAAGVMAAWVVGVLSAIYKWGIPAPIRRPFVSAIVTVGLLGLTTWGAAVLMPTFGGGKVSALGSVGVMLLWSYVIGFIVIVVPALVPSIEDVARGVTS
jgi:membrane protein